jgi:long-chain acyl-CoA synthetase
MILANQNKLNSLEKPKQFTLLAEPWTPESGMLTPTMKMKRNIGKERLSADIKRMYEEPIMKENKGGAKVSPAEKKN